MLTPNRQRLLRNKMMQSMGDDKPIQTVAAERQAPQIVIRKPNSSNTAIERKTLPTCQLSAFISNVAVPKTENLKRGSVLKRCSNCNRNFSPIFLVVVKVECVQSVVVVEGCSKGFGTRDTEKVASKVECVQSVISLEGLTKGSGTLSPDMVEENIASKEEFNQCLIIGE